MINNFIHVLFGNLPPEEYVEFRFINSAKELPPVCKFYTRTNIDEFLKSSTFIALRAQYDVYFGTWLRKQKSGTKQDVSQCSVLWADMDYKDFPGGEAEARERLNTFQLEPSIVINTGNGLHVYWILSQPITDKELAEKYLKGIALTLGGDLTACEVARILRLPYTFNRKDKKNPKSISIEHLNESLKYDISMFNPYLSIEIPTKNTPTSEIQEISEGQRNTKLASTGGALRRQGLNENAIYEALSSINVSSCVPPLDDVEVKQIAKSVSKYPVKSDDQRTSSSKKERVWIDIPSLVDLVSDEEGNPAYLTKEGNELKLFHHHETENEIYFPPNTTLIPWNLPKAANIFRYYQEDTDLKLYEDLRAYFQSASDLPSQDHYDLITTWVFHTYVYEKSQYSPVIYLLAEHEKGKTRTGKAMAYTARRGVLVESLRDPYLIRLTNNYKASLFFDGIDIWEKAKKENSVDIINNRFEKGTVVWRVNNPEKGAFEDMVSYEIYGPTIIATNVPADPIFESRCIQINMRETEKLFDNQITKEEAIEFRERLVAFRARHFDEALPEVVKPRKGRLGDFCRPLLQIARVINPAITENLIRLMNDVEKDRTVAKSLSLQAEIIKAVGNLSGHVEAGILLTQAITEKLNEGRTEKFRFKDQSIGRKLTSLGFKKARFRGLSGIEYDQVLIKRLSVSYGLDNPSLPSLPSSPLNREDEGLGRYEGSLPLEGLFIGMVDRLTPNGLVLFDGKTRTEFLCQISLALDLVSKSVQFRARFDENTKAFVIESNIEILLENPFLKSA